MSKTDLSKIKGQTPLSIIVHGGNYISFLLAKTLLEQGSHVVIIDRYTNNSKKFFNELKKSGKVTFIDFKGIKNFYEKVARIDYLFYMLGEKIYSTDKIDNKDFLSETDYLNSSITAGNKYKAKMSLVTSLELNRALSNRINNAVTSKTKPYSPLELQRYGENHVAEFVDKSKANLRIIRLGTIFGKGVNQISDEKIDKLFIDATQKHQIEIDGEGLELHNIIHESDAVYGILKLTFSEDTSGEVISLCNKNDYTTLSLAYKLLELDVEAKAIKFVEREDADTILQDLYIPAPNATRFGWKQNITLEDSTIEQIEAYYEKSDRKWELDKTVGREKGEEEEKLSTVSRTKLGSIVHSLTKPFRRIAKPKEFFTEIDYFKILKYFTITVISTLLLYFLIAPIIGLILGGALLYGQGKNLNTAITELDFDEIGRNSQNISQNTGRIENNLTKLSWLFKITNTQEHFSNINQIVQGTRYFSQSAQDLVMSLRPLGEYLKDFEPNLASTSSETHMVDDYSEYLSSLEDNTYILKEGIYTMTLAQNLINSVDTAKFPKFTRKYILEYKDLITKTSNTVKPLERLTLFLPDLLGVNERKRYLILFQDNSEIRSTGGWISNYAVIALEGGQIRELFIDDIYNAQATLNLKNYSSRTPNSMLRALPNTTFSFPLVNWDPNLESVLLSAEQFIYDLGKGTNLDGIITVDTSFIQKLLATWGGIEIPGENELITETNLYQKMYEIEPDTDPNSLRSSPFLTNLFDSVITKFFSSKFNDYKQLHSVFSEALFQKNISMTFKNSIARGYVNENGWDSNIDAKFLTTPTSIDWNWGVNKATLYSKKAHSLEINVRDEKTIDYYYKVVIQNDSSTEQYPEGEYRNYIRIFLPHEAKVTGIRGFEENRQELYEESGYRIIAGWVNTPIKESKTLEISYRLIKDDNPSNFILRKSDTHYELDINIYKQSGSKKDTYNLSLFYPDNWTVEQTDGLSIIENSASKRFELSSNEHYYISWQR